jgi:ABC-type proline/glycine betaine transport system ATPase subunit
LCPPSRGSPLCKRSSLTATTRASLSEWFCGKIFLSSKDRTIHLESEAMIELKGVTKEFLEGSTRHVVLDSLDLRIDKGEIVILYGKSGSGKSTLLNIISGIDVPERGSVAVDGTDITRLPERDRTLVRRRRIGFIFQFFNLVPENSNEWPSPGH